MDEMARAYDVVVIGAGPTGENLADRTRAAGLSTVIVESELVGGECSYWACMPSKALLRPMAARADALRVDAARQAVTAGLDTAAVLARLDAFTSGGAPADPELDQLTAREQEVMRLLARGYAYKEIARELSISIKTVESHASAVLRKLQLSSRHELTAWATERRLL